MLSNGLYRRAASARLLLQLAEERALDPQACLRGTGLSPHELARPDHEIRTCQEERLIANIVSLLGPGSDFAVAAGRRYRLEMFGMLSFACMSASTPREMLEIWLRYQDLAFTLAHAEAQRGDTHTFIVLTGSHLATPVRRFAIEQCISTIWAGLAEVDDTAPRPRVELSVESPSVQAAFVEHFGVPVRLSCTSDRIGYPNWYFDQPRSQSDPAALISCVAQCRDLLTRRRAQVNMRGKVSDLLTRDPASSMRTVASQLDISVRTLRRALAAEGATFRQLHDEIRRERSTTILLNGGAGLDLIATTLGYATTPAFVRAFKRWQGLPPGAWRASGMQSNLQEIQR